MATKLATPRRRPRRVHHVEVEQQLARAQGRIRTIDVLSGLLLIAVASLAYLLVVMLIDHWLNLTDATRQILLGGFALAVVAYTAVAVLGPSFRRVNPYFAARVLEKASPQSRNGLINWLDLRREKLPPAIREAIEHRAEEEIEHADVEEAIPSRWPLRLFMVAAFLLITFLGLRLILPDQFSSLVSRAVYPFTPKAIPTTTRLQLKLPVEDEIVDDPASAPLRRIQVKRRSVVEVAVLVHGLVPPSVYMEYRSSLTDGPVRKLLRPPAKKELYWTTTISPELIPNDGLYFRLFGGDGQTREYHLVYPPKEPDVLDIEIRYEYPAYTKRPPKTQHEGNIKAIVGTKVFLSCLTDVPVTRGEAILYVGDKVHRVLPLQVVAETPQANQRQRLAFSMPLELTRDLMAKEPARYRIQMTSTERLSGSSPNYSLVVEPDRAPWVELRKVGQEEIQPEQEVIRLAVNDVVPVVGEVGDDIAADTVRYRIRTTDGRELFAQGPDSKAGPLQEATGFTPMPAPFQLTLDLTRLVSRLVDGPKEPVALRVGDRLEFWIEATDNCEPKANVGESKHYFIELTKPLDKKQRQQKEQQNQREQQKQQQQNQQSDKPQDQQRQDQPRDEQNKQQQQSQNQNQAKQNEGKNDQKQSKADQRKGGKKQGEEKNNEQDSRRDDQPRQGDQQRERQQQETDGPSGRQSAAAVR